MTVTGWNSFLKDEEKNDDTLLKNPAGLAQELMITVECSIGKVILISADGLMEEHKWRIRADMYSLSQFVMTFLKTYLYINL